MKEETVTSNGSSQANVVNKGNQVLKLGLDTHYQQVTVAMQEDGRPDQGGRENAARGFSKLGGQKSWKKAGKSTAVTKPEPEATGYIAS
jgi:hypothetical protein